MGWAMAGESPESSVRLASAGGAWWAARTVPEEAWGCWRIGPLQVWVWRGRKDWRLGWVHGEDPMDARVEVGCPVAAPEGEGTPAKWRTVAVAGTGEAVRLEPRCADRPVVVRPMEPTSLPAGEAVRLYVSTPAWVAVHVAGVAEPVAEMPTWRPHDTWSGSSVDGEICYASRSRGRRELDEDERLGHRIVTPLEIKNAASKTVEVDRIALPVPHLSVFAGDDGRLYTESLVLSARERTALADVEIRRGQPPEAGSGQLLSGPRAPRHEMPVVRLFADLLHRVGGGG